MPLPFLLVIRGHPILSFIFLLLIYTNYRSIFSSFHHFSFLPNMSQEAELRHQSEPREGKEDCTDCHAPCYWPPVGHQGPQNSLWFLKPKVINSTSLHSHDVYARVWSWVITFPETHFMRAEARFIVLTDIILSVISQFHRFYYLTQGRIQMGTNPHLWLYAVTMWCGENTCHFLELTL